MINFILWLLGFIPTTNSVLVQDAARRLEKYRQARQTAQPGGYKSDTPDEP
jgi:hypothetical protein